MADDGLFLAGRSLLLDVDGQVERYLNDWLCHEGMVECPPRALTDRRADPYGDRYHSFPLPMPNYPSAPPIRINQLYWPTGAMRHARGYFLCTETDAAALRTAGYLSDATTSEGTIVKQHVPLQFIARLGGNTFSASMFMLAPRPLTSIVGQRLWLVPLVDDRYWWTQKGIGSHPQRSPLVLENDFEFSTWDDVWTAISSEIGTFYVSPFTNRFNPDPWEFTRQFENVAHMLDVAAHSCGLRVVRQPNGSTALASVAESLVTRVINWQSIHAIIAGDTWTAHPMSERLQVMFQRLIEGALDKRDQWWRVDMAKKPYAVDADITIIDDSCNTWDDATDPEKSFGVSNCNEVLWTTFHANFDHTRPDCPTNNTDVAAVARDIYKQHYAWQLADGMDVTFAGIQTWLLSGLEDYLFINFGTESSPSTELHFSPQPRSYVDRPEGLRNPPAPPEILTTRPRKLTTRVRSMPQEFGIRHVLCQTDEFLRVQEHEPYFKIIEFTPEGGSSIKFLEPGGFAYAKAVWLDGDTWTEFGSLDLTIKIHDPNYLACGLIDEVLHATWSDERHRWEVDREHGLRRRAVADEDIAVDDSGNVILWTDKAVTDPEISVEAWLDWMVTEDVDATTELLVEYRRDEKAWLATNAGCAGA